MLVMKLVSSLIRNGAMMHFVYVTHLFFFPFEDIVTKVELLGQSKIHTHVCVCVLHIHIHTPSVCINIYTYFLRLILCVVVYAYVIYTCIHIYEVGSEK